MDDGEQTMSETDADHGPECGSPEARAWLRLDYAKAGRVAWTEERFCCVRHIPDLGDALSADSSLLALTIGDSLTMTIISADGTVQTFLNAIDASGMVADCPEDWPAGHTIAVGFAA